MISLVRDTVLIGAGATLCIDAWGLVQRAFGTRPLDYCLLGRWVLHMPGRFAHERIGAAVAKRGECAMGWTAHYTIGIALAFVFLQLTPGWLAHPSLAPALGFGIITVLIPFLTMQPAFGLGVAASRAPHPWKARLRSLATHMVFGLGLFLCGWLLRLG